MATIYKAIITIANKHVVVTGATPAALGTAIGNAIPADPRDDVEIVYDVRGPLSRRMIKEEE